MNNKLKDLESFLSTLDYHTAKSFTAESVQMLRDLESGRLQPLRTSLKSLNKGIFGFLPTDLVTIAGRTGTGKTSWIVQAIEDFTNSEINPAHENKVAIFYDSWEMSGWRGMLKFASYHEKKTMSDIMDYQKALNKETIDRIENKLNNIKSSKSLFISEMATTPQGWLDKKRKIYSKIKNDGYQIVNFIDHLRLITKQNQFTEESLITDMMKAAVIDKKQHKSITFLLSQMNRNIETNQNSRRDIGSSLPVSSDIFGADSIQQFSDILIALFRPGLYKVKEFKLGNIRVPTGLSNTSVEDTLLIQEILKCRFGNIGTILSEHLLKYNRIKDFDKSKLDTSVGFSKL